MKVVMCDACKQLFAENEVKDARTCNHLRMDRWELCTSCFDKYRAIKEGFEKAEETYRNEQEKLMKSALTNMGLQIDPPESGSELNF